MNKNLLCACLLASCAISYGQVGVNTNNPQGVFNVDAKKNNPTSGSSFSEEEQGDDFVITNSGQVGIGTINPSQKLEIHTGGTQASPVTGFKLVDGNQFNSLVLTSDSDGVGTWKPVSLTTVMGVIPSGPGAGDYAFQSNATWQSTHSSIKLPQGTWKVEVTELLRYNGSVNLDAADYMWVRFTFADSDATFPNDDGLTKDLVGSTKFISGNILGPSTGAQKYGLAQGSVIIKNTSAVAKTYYLLVGSSTSSVTDPKKTISTVGSSSWGENIITAFPISQ